MIEWSNKWILVIHKPDQLDVKIDRLKEIVKEQDIYPCEVRLHKYMDGHESELDTVRAHEARVQELQKRTKTAEDYIALADKWLSENPEHVPWQLATIISDAVKVTQEGGSGEA